jgi:hypothetical protein
MSILDEVKRLAVSECANFSSQMNGIRNHCWGREANGYVCYLFGGKDAQRCPYFEKAVLPLDGDLEEAYFAGFSERREEDGEKVEHREPNQGEGFGKSPSSIPGNPGKVEVKRLSLAKAGREGFLSRR